MPDSACHAGGRASTPVSPTGCAERVYGGTGNDLLVGGQNADSLYGGGGKDVLTGLAGGDYLSGDSGGDRVVGGPGQDSVNGGTGPDKLIADDGEVDNVDGGVDGATDTCTCDGIDNVTNVP